MAIRKHWPGTISVQARLRVETLADDHSLHFPVARGPDAIAAAKRVLDDSEAKYIVNGLSVDAQFGCVVRAVVPRLSDDPFADARRVEDHLTKLLRGEAVEPL